MCRALTEKFQRKSYFSRTYTGRMRGSGGDVEAFRKGKITRNRAVVYCSELVLVHDLVTLTKSSKGRIEKMKIVHKCMRSIFEVFYVCSEEGSEMSTSNDLCWKSFCLVVY